MAKVLIVLLVVKVQGLTPLASGLLVVNAFPVLPVSVRVQDPLPTAPLANPQLAKTVQEAFVPQTTGPEFEPSAKYTVTVRSPTKLFAALKAEPAEIALMPKIKSVVPFVFGSVTTVLAFNMEEKQKTTTMS